MKLEVDRNFFSDRDEVYADIRRTGFWPTTYVSTTSPELPLHWHNGDIIGYVIEGESYLLDSEGERVTISAGDRLRIPAGALHAEGEVTDTVVYIVTTRNCASLFEELTMLDPAAHPEPVPLPLDPEFLAQFAPPGS